MPVLKKHGLHATFFIATGFLNGGRMWNDKVVESIRASALPEIDTFHLGLGHVAILTIDQKRKAIAQIIAAIKHMPASQRDEAADNFRESCEVTLLDNLMLSQSQLIGLRQAGMGIGAHTVNHPILATLDRATARREMAESRECLEGLLGEPVSLFAYPNGGFGRDYTQEHVELVKLLGFEAAVSTNWGSCGKKSDVYQLPRFTPWDLHRWRFGLRMLKNFRTADLATTGLDKAERYVSVKANSAAGLAQGIGSALKPRDAGPVTRTKDIPLISVIIPCYNAERWIAATLRSVQAQKWDRIEIIVVDDGSTDRSVEVLRLDFPEVVLLQQPNRGVAAARNHGIRLAKGSWIAFIDADDIWLPGKLTVQWEVLSAHPEARMAYTAWQVWPSIEVEPNPELLRQISEAASHSMLWVGSSGWIYPDLLQDCVVWTSTVLAQRSVFEDVGVFDEELRIGEDYDLWLRVSRATQIIRVPKPLALYRAHPMSVTRSAPTVNFQAMVIERALGRWGYTSPDGRSASRHDVDRALARTWRDYAGAHLAAGGLREAQQATFMALKKDFKMASTWRLLAKIALRSAQEALR
jgi:GT2 family glycosyltransferase/peptidoglycan/xylan/chitin deacetylase (PgdA/CDA1 family)